MARCAWAVRSPTVLQSPGGPAKRDDRVHRPTRHRLAIELDLFSARRRAAQYRPFTPAWDAAITEVEDLEREVWHRDQPLDLPAIHPVPGRNSRPNAAASSALSGLEEPPKRAQSVPPAV